MSRTRKQLSAIGRLVVAAGLLALGGAACSSSGSNASPAVATTSTPTTERPPGPAATVSNLSGGKGTILVSTGDTPDLQKSGYVQEEYAVAGTAHAYATKGAYPEDGKIALTPTTSAPYKTRIVVRRPKDPASFSGTVVVEWLNVSGGLDAAPDWTYAADELVRNGDAWVGVSAQRIGVEGGPVAVMTPVSEAGGAGKGIKTQDPARYSSLHHPGDAYSYDIYTQVARALRGPGAIDPLDGEKAAHVLAMGESQSAFALTTYYDGVQPLTNEFDGFLVHSRGDSALPLGEPGKGTDISSSVGGDPVKFRTDGDAPVLAVETETDVLGLLDYVKARQPDTNRIRVWEVAGTADVDTGQLGSVAKLFGCSEPINSGPDEFVVRAALVSLRNWVATGAAPPHAARLESAPDGKTYALDANGNAKGGVRTPPLDVPVDVLSGLPAPGGSVACLLAGTTEPIPPARLAALYSSRADYLAKFAKSTDAAIKAGFVLQADRKAMLATSQPDRIG